MKKYLLIFALPIVLFSCSESVVETTNEPEPEEETEVTYNNKIKGFFQSNCTTCHSGATPPAGIDLTTYQNAKQQVSSGKVLAAMRNEGNPMPPSGLLSSTQTDLIQAWIDNGFLEN